MEVSWILMSKPHHFVSEMIIGRTNKMSFYYRLEGYLYLLYARLVLAPRIFSAQDALAKKYFGSSCPSTKDMVRNRSLLLSSSMWIFEYTRPVFPNTIHVGPLHIGDTKPLPQVKLDDKLEWSMTVSIVLVNKQPYWRIFYSDYSAICDEGFIWKRKRNNCSTRK